MSSLPFQVLRPRRSVAGQYQSGEVDGFTARLAKYVPINITLAFPVIEGVLKKRIGVRETILGLPPIALGWILFLLLLVISILWLHKEYREVPEQDRKVLELPHILGRIAAFTLWTYLIGSVIWGDLYDPDVSLIAAGLAMAVNGLYRPTVSVP